MWCFCAPQRGCHSGTAAPLGLACPSDQRSEKAIAALGSGSARGGWVLERVLNFVQASSRQRLAVGTQPVVCVEGRPNQRASACLHEGKDADPRFADTDPHRMAGAAGARAQETLKGLYPGQPNRATARPTGKRLLRAFARANITCVPEGNDLRLSAKGEPSGILRRFRPSTSKS